MADKQVIFEADIDVDKAIAETARLKEQVTKLTFETEHLKRSQGETSAAYIKSKASLQTASESLKKHELIVKNVIKANSDNSKSIGVFDGVAKDVPKRLREINVEMGILAANGEQNSARFIELQAEGGRLQDTLDEVRARIKLYASDTKSLDQAIAVFKGIGAAAQVAESAQALLGTENEDLTRSIQKLVAIQGVMNGLQEIQIMLQKESGVMLLANDLKLKALAAAQAIYSTAVGTSTGALKLFRVALLSTGIGAIVVGIGLLIANWDKLTGSVDAGTKAIDGNRIANDEARESYNKSIKEIRDLKIEYDLLTGKITDAEAGVLRLKNEYNDSITAISNDTEKGVASATGWWSKFKDGVMAAGNPMLTAQLQARRVADEVAIGAQKIEEINRVQREKEKIANEKLRQEKEQAQIDEANKEAKRKQQEADAYQAHLDAMYNKDVADYIKRNQLEYERVKMEQEIADRQAEIRENARRLAKKEDERARNEEKQRRLLALEEDFNNRYDLAQRDVFMAIEMESQKNMRMYEAEMADAEVTGADKLLIMEKYAQLEMELERMKTDAKLSLTADFMGNLATLFGEGTAIGKAAAITETIINTYKGAQAAYASLSPIPIVGPALGIAAAAAQVKTGMDTVKKIKATGGGGGGGGSVSMPTGAIAATAPMAASSPNVSMGAIAGQVGASTGQIVAGAKTQGMQVAVVVDDVTAKQTEQSEAIKMTTL